MKILVTGAGGFAGRHLARELRLHGHEILALDAAFRTPVEGARASFALDLRDGAGVARVFASERPDACVHLGAISSVPAGETDPGLMLTVNVNGTLSVLEAVRAEAPACRLLVVSTSQVYGQVQGDQPIPESARLAPVSLYVISKVAAESAAFGYARHFGLPVVIARPTNHTGPGQSPAFVVGSLVRQFREIAAKAAPAVLKVGNLASERVVCDVRDVARAYRLLLEKGVPGEAYNICSGRHVRIGSIIDRLEELTGVRPDRQVDPARFRPTDRYPALDTAKLRALTGWQPEIDLRRTLEDMLAAG